MKYLFLTIFLMQVSLECLCMEIKGKVVDKSGNPIEFANVIAINDIDSSFVTGTTTDAKGLFSIQFEPRTQKLKISCIGFENLLTVPTDSNQVFTLKKSSILLDSVTVKGNLPRYKISDEGIRTSVHDNVLSKAGNAEDVLRHVPGIIERNGTWEVFGRDAAIIYLNGRRLYDLTELDRLPSSNVKDVEVINNPGSQYPASVSSVIKIRTILTQGEGFSLKARSTYRYNSRSNFIETLTAGYRHNGLNLSFTYEYERNNFLLQNTRLNMTVNADTLWLQNARMQNSSVAEDHWLQGQASYDFTDGHSIGVKYSIDLLGNRHTDRSYDAEMMADGSLYDRLHTLTISREFDKPVHRLNAYYTGNIGKTNIDFNTDLYFNHTIDESNNDENSQGYDSRVFSTKNSSKSSMTTSCLSFSSPLFGGSLSYGLEYIHTNRKQLYTSSNTGIIASSNSEITEQTTAPFIEYKHKIGKGSLDAGLRYEYIDFDYSEDDVRKPEQSRTFRDFYPSVRFSTKIGNTTWQLVYSVRARRPNYLQLSNNVYYYNRFMRQTGTPLLTNQTDHSMSLVSVWKFVQLTMQYTDKRNAIIYWYDEDPDNEAVTLMKYCNQHSLKTFTSFVNAAPKVGLWSPQFSAGIIRPWLTLNTSFGRKHFNKPIFQASFNNAFNLPHNLTVSIDYSFTSKGNLQNVYLTRMQSILDVSLSKSLFNNALVVQLKGSDLLYQKRDAIEMYTDKVTLNQNSRYETRKIELTLRYRFNVGKDKYKGKGVGQEEINRL